MLHARTRTHAQLARAILIDTHRDSPLTVTGVFVFFIYARKQKLS